MYGRFDNEAFFVDFIDVDVVVNGFGASTVDCPAVCRVNSFVKSVCISNKCSYETIAINDEYRRVFDGKERDE